MSFLWYHSAYYLQSILWCVPLGRTISTVIFCPFSFLIPRKITVPLAVSIVLSNLWLPYEEILLSIWLQYASGDCSGIFSLTIRDIETVWVAHAAWVSIAIAAITAFAVPDLFSPSSSFFSILATAKYNGSSSSIEDTCSKFIFII